MSQKADLSHEVALASALAALGKTTPVEVDKSGALFFRGNQCVVRISPDRKTAERIHGQGSSARVHSTYYFAYASPHLQIKELESCGMI